MKPSSHFPRIRLGRCGTVRCEPGWHLGPDWAPRLEDFDLWFVRAGRGRMVLEDGEVALGPGSAIWMRPGRRYEATQDPEARLTVHYLHFTWAGPRGGRFHARGEPPAEAMQTRQVDFTDAVLRRVIALMREPAGRAVAEGLFAAAMAGLVHEQAELAEGRGEAGIDKHHGELVRRAAARIRESPGDVPPVAELARGAGYHTDHFSRIFAKMMGVGPQEYIIQAKMERARELLAQSALSVGMIAEALGFRDIYFFSRQFSQQTGMPPTRYRRSLDRAVVKPRGSRANSKL